MHFPNPVECPGLQLFQGAPVTTPHGDLPPILRGSERMGSRFGHDVGALYPGLGQHGAQSRRFGNAVRGIEAPVQVGPDRLDRFPKNPVGGLEQARTPGRDRQAAAGPDHAPQLHDRPGHVGHEEDAEHAHHGVEASVGITEVQHVGDAELDVPQGLGFRLGLRQGDQIPGEVGDHFRPCTDDLLVLPAKIGKINYKSII